MQIHNRETMIAYYESCLENARAKALIYASDGYAMLANGWLKKVNEIEGWIEEEKNANAEQRA